MKFMGIYFESLHNLLGRNEDAVNICEKVGMCFKNEASVTFSDNGMGCETGFVTLKCHQPIISLLLI